MQGYGTNFVNLITDNLRDRYDNGFPILKELIQNADDARAHNFVFSQHPGFTSATHPLLQGPGLWFFNDGEFKDDDPQNLRSFGINSKAGDLTTIGKFGLGMKSVYHLCEALFYIASDGVNIHREGLTPWKQEHSNPHPEWDHIEETDWKCIQDIAEIYVKNSEKPWFLLWVPLRREIHLRTSDGEEAGAIISSFPGDHPGDMAFLDEANLSTQLAEILPLLRHLESIHYEDQRNGFALRLETEQRLLGACGNHKTHGQVTMGQHPLIHFAGQRLIEQDDEDWVSRLKKRKEWPRSRYRDQKGREIPIEDKTSAEAAVLFCMQTDPMARSDLQWAVFLPLEQGSEMLLLNSGVPRHSVVLHGQFFVDAGRKKIYGLEKLHEPAEENSDLDDS